MKALLTLPLNLSCNIKPLSPLRLKFILILICLIVNSLLVLAQAKQWDKTFGGTSDERLSTIAVALDGGYIIGGTSSSDISGDKSEASRDTSSVWFYRGDYWVVKMDADGNKVWDRTFGGSGPDVFTAVLATPDGGYLLGGTSSSGINGDKTQASKGGSDYWVVKLDENGKKQWDKTFGGDKDENLQALALMTDGNYMLGGSSNSGMSGDKSEASRDTSEIYYKRGDYWMVKIDENGNKLWDKRFGGNDQDNLSVLIATADGGFLLGGYSRSCISGDKTAEDESSCGDFLDYWVVKVNGTGNKVWDKTFDSKPVVYDDYLQDIVATPDGGYLLGGYTQKFDSPEVLYFVVKINSQGTKIWQKEYSRSFRVINRLQTLAVTTDGNYLLAGYTANVEINAGTWGPDYNRDYWLVKIDKEGNQLSNRAFFGNNEDFMQAIIPTNDGGFLLGGYSASGQSSDKSELSRGETDYWVIKMDANNKSSQAINFKPVPDLALDEPPITLSAIASSGLPVSFSDVSGPATLSGNRLTVKGLGAVTVKASQPGNDTYLPAEAVVSFQVKKHPAPKQWDKTFGGSSYDWFTDMTITADGGYLLGGTSYSGKGGDKTEVNKGDSDYWLVKINSNGRKEWDKVYGGPAGDFLRKIIAAADGTFLLAGTSNSGIGVDKSQASRGGSDYWLVKIDGSGNKVWDKTFGGDGEDIFTDITTTPDGHHLLAGYSTSNVSGDKSQVGGPSWVVNIDNNGNKIWDRVHNITTDAIISTPDSGYLLGSSSTNEERGFYKVDKFDVSGNKVWDRIYYGPIRYDRNSSTHISDIVGTSDNAYILGGSTSTENDFGEFPGTTNHVESYWVLKIDADGNEIWSKGFRGSENFSDNGLTTLISAPNGGFLLGGYSDSENGDDKSQVNRGGLDYWVVKIDRYGDKLWDKTLGSSGNDYLNALVATPDGSYLLGGYTDAGMSGDKTEASQGGSDYWVVKIKEEGTPPPNPTAWNLRYGGSNIDRFTVVIRPADGGYLSGGYSNSEVSGDKSQASRGGADYWIVKTDVNGVKQWDKHYGGSNHDYLNRIIPTLDGGYLLAGSSTSGKGGDKSEDSRGNQDYWIIKISSDGTKQWDKTYGGSGFDDLRKVNQLSNGDYLLAGTSDSPISGEKSQSSQGGKDYWIVRIDSKGNKRWDKTYGGSGEEHLESFTKTSNGGFLLAGSSTSGKSGSKSQASRGGKDYWLVRINSRGSVLWDKSYGGEQDDALYSIGITSSGEYFVAGHSSSGQSGDKSQVSQGASDYWMLKLSSTGEKLWDKSYGGSGTETLRSIIQMHDGGYVLAGSSDSPSSGDKSQQSQGGMDYWIIKTDAQGSKEYDQRYGGSGNEEFRYIQRTNDGGLLLGGRSDSGISGDRTQPSQGAIDYWLVKVLPQATTVTASAAKVITKSEMLAAVNFNAYPNPATSGQVTVTFSVAQSQPVQVQVYNIQGRVVRTLFRGEAQSGQEYKTTWSTKNQVVGMYILQLQTPSKTRTQKLMVLQ